MNYNELSKEELIRELEKEKAKNARKFLSHVTDLEVWSDGNSLVVVNGQTGDRKYYYLDKREKDNWYYNFQEEYPEAKTLKELREKAINSGRKFNPKEMYGCNGYKRMKAIENSFEEETSIYNFFQ